MKFEEYENIMSELWHVANELYHKKGIKIGDEISDIDFKLSTTYTTENIEVYEKKIEKYKKMLE